MALTDQLIAYWKMDGNSNDSLGAFNGTDTSITYSSGNGIINNGAGFANASNSKIVLTDAAALHPTNFSVNMWLKTSTSNSHGGSLQLMQVYAQVTTVAGWWMAQSTGDKLMITIGKNTGVVINTDFKQLTSATSITGGVFKMWTFTYDGSNINIYLNGNATPDATVANTINPVYAATTYSQFGIENDSGTDVTGFAYDGAMDEVGYWSRALSTSEISQLYNGGVGLSYPFGTTSISGTQLHTLKVG